MPCIFCKCCENVYSVLFENKTIQMCVDCFGVKYLSHKVVVVLDKEVNKVVIKLEKKI